MPHQVMGEALDVRRAGSYFVLSLTAPGISEDARPGQFVTVAIGGLESSMLLRRAFAIHRVQSRGVYGGTLEIAVSPHGLGSRWLTERRRHDQLSIVGPLGKPFSIPSRRVSCVLVGGGYGSAPLFMLAEHLRDNGCRVDVLIGASTEEKLFGVLDLKRLSSSITVTTEDGSSGETGRVTDRLAELIDRSSADIVYACGPMGMLSAISAITAKRRVFTQCSVEESMACGIGVCMTCVLPVIGDDGVTRMVRSCVEGPTMRGDRVRWADVGTIPADAWGAAEAP
ncbi:MAG: dihydroorotate dehydrogenase electron transfer subunit [Actinobacteria bacterium]|nr:dihydroorotate dehydrogenase electron transfer subunit [Actinomycetota bacterium]